MKMEKRGIYEKKLGINQLLWIVTIALFCDHIAWRCPDYPVPVVQIFWALGRMIMPIVCYGVVEEFKTSSNHRNLLLFMIGVWFFSIYPYNLYMGSMFQKRQNLIYDILLMVLTLEIIQSREKRKISCSTAGVFLVIVFGLSWVTSGWPVISLILSIILYKKGMNTKEAVRLVSAVLLVQMVLNMGISVFRFSPGVLIQKHWYDNLYLLGYLLAIPVLLIYNGDGKKKRKTKFLFFVIYPLHFLLLSSIFNIWEYRYFDFYLRMHGGTVILLIAFGAIALRTKPSRAQLFNILLIVTAVFYMIGYYLELTAPSLEVVYIAKKVEYCGLVGIFMMFTRFMDAFFHIQLKKMVYVLETVVSLVMVSCVFTMEDNKLLCRNVILYRREGYTFVRYEQGLIGILFLICVIIMFIMLFIFYLKAYPNKYTKERKRCRYIMIGGSLPIICLCLESCGAYFMTYGIMGFMWFFHIAFVRDDSFSKVQTEAEKDPLTGVGNRRYFINMVENGLSNRRKGTLIMLDMDDFKYVNDTFGHRMGD